MSIGQLRKEYHSQICQQIIRWTRDGETRYPNFADKGNTSSRAIAVGIVERLDCCPQDQTISGQKAGGLFEALTCEFLEASFSLLSHLRPGEWYYSAQTPISAFDQYKHLVDLERYIKGNTELILVLGEDYIITPDIVVGRWPVSDEQVNVNETVLDTDCRLAHLTPLRSANFETQCAILHASISCKWTLRSDQGQNARTEALNLIRNRKGRLPHIVSVTAEPLPTRIASLALGTGDIDCVYHFALDELEQTIQDLGNQDQLDMLSMLVDGRRLRDISDLPFDLAI
ncbi:MAG: restriction endonuclease [Anaerolineae bacterium]|nr:restriction endonuclease [Anaerolineae bacterium]